MVPPDSHLPVLNKAQVNSQLSSKFKAYNKSRNGKSYKSSSKLNSKDEDYENHNSQLINIQANELSSSNDMSQSIAESKMQSRGSSYTRKTNYSQKPTTIFKQKSNFDAPKPKKKHNYDSNLNRLETHPLYKNNSKSKKAKKIGKH